MKRIEVNDPDALREMGYRRRNEGDFDGAFEYWTKAAWLGDAGSHYELSLLYLEGQVVEEDEKKALYHLEQATMRGHPNARNNLAVFEWRNGRRERAVKHFIIGANLGFDRSLESVKKCYTDGLVSKDDFASALRAHQAAIDATKSPQREAAVEYRRMTDSN